MPERVQLWWARRQFSKGAAVPYEVGTYREAWAAFPALVRQYHPELNAGITLSQIPPAADVLLLWQCESGHKFAATPGEQRSRPGRERRRSAWCPECSEAARGVVALPMRDRVSIIGVPRMPPHVASATPSASSTPLRARRTKPPRTICAKTPELPVGDPFMSECAPKPASAVEARMRTDVFARISVTAGMNAVRVGRPFFQHLEVWPDLLLPELRVAVEYDSIGRHGLEHVGAREAADKRKDRALRGAGWEVVRIRTARLQAIGPFDIEASDWNRRGLDRLLDTLREIRGPLFVDPYLG
jgi:hypothetical protein